MGLLAAGFLLTITYYYYREKTTGLIAMKFSGIFLGLFCAGCFSA
jgi:hypothetical protein